MNRVLAELHEATDALREANEQLKQERRTRRLGVALIAVAIVVLFILAAISWDNARDIRSQAQDIQEQSEAYRVAECESRNDTRLAIRGVLEFIIDLDEAPSEEALRLLDELDRGVLETQRCDA